MVWRSFGGVLRFARRNMAQKNGACFSFGGNFCRGEA